MLVQSSLFRYAVWNPEVVRAGRTLGFSSRYVLGVEKEEEK